MCRFYIIVVFSLKGFFCTCQNKRLILWIVTIAFHKAFPTSFFPFLKHFCHFPLLQSWNEPLSAQLLSQQTLWPLCFLYLKQPGSVMWRPTTICLAARDWPLQRAATAKTTFHSYKAPAAFLESLHRVTADGVGASTEECDQRSDFIRC